MRIPVPTTPYDTIIHNYLSTGKFLPKLLLSYNKVMDLRYGENPHNQLLFIEREITEPCIPHAKQLKQLWGKKLSFNNILDLNAALELIRAFEEPTVARIKHTNPEGIASHPLLYQAWKYAWKCDPVSAFGGIIANNRKLSVSIAEDIDKVFVELVIAPSYQEEALEIPQHKKNLRILFCKGKRTVGIGARQMNRIHAIKIATMKSREDTTNPVMASDAFFPFRDGIDEGAKVGVAAVIEPGGSVKYKEAIQAANEYGIALMFTGRRTFKH